MGVRGKKEKRRGQEHHKGCITWRDVPDLVIHSFICITTSAKSLAEGLSARLTLLSALQPAVCSPLLVSSSGLFASSPAGTPAPGLLLPPPHVDDPTPSLVPSHHFLVPACVCWGEEVGLGDVRIRSDTICNYNNCGSSPIFNSDSPPA